MTYTLNNTTTMVLADIGDTFTIDPMLIFLRDGKEVPVATAIPSISDITILENPIADGYDVELTHANGRYTARFFYTLEAVASYIQFLALHSPSEAAPATHVADDTTPDTDAAQAAPDASEAAPADTVCQYITKLIRPRAKRVVDLCDKCIRLRKENNYAAADSELTDIINTAKLLRLDVAGWIPMDEWGAINRRAAAATDGGGDPRYWGYIAAEYIKWAEQQLSTATA